MPKNASNLFVYNMLWVRHSIYLKPYFVTWAWASWKMCSESRVKEMAVATIISVKRFFLLLIHWMTLPKNWWK